MKKLEFYVKICLNIFELSRFLVACYFPNWRKTKQNTACFKTLKIWWEKLICQPLFMNETNVKILWNQLFIRQNCRAAFLSSQMLITDYNFRITTINCNDSQHFNPLKSMWKQLFLFCSVILWIIFLSTVEHQLGFF